MSDIKVAILEEDGVDFDIPTEYLLSIFDVLPVDKLPTGTVWNIRDTEQLLLVNELEIEGDGEIIIDGTLGIL